MDTKVTVIYDNPLDPPSFEAGYPAQLTLASQIPNVNRVESAKVWPKEDGSRTPAYRLLDLYFADYDVASAAVTTPEASTFLANVFQLATGGARITFAAVEQASVST